MIWFLNDPFWSPAASLLIAVFSGIARQFYEQIWRPKRKTIPGQFQKEVYIATVCGLAALLLGLTTGITGYGIHLACLAAAWTSPNVLRYVSRKFEKDVGAEEGELTGAKRTTSKEK